MNKQMQNIKGIFLIAFQQSFNSLWKFKSENQSEHRISREETLQAKRERDTATGAII